jgi:5-methylcytosine-specific restriction endonuclease McrA
MQTVTLTPPESQVLTASDPDSEMFAAFEKGLTQDIRPTKSKTINQSLRSMVLARDHGICAACHMDCILFRKGWRPFLTKKARHTWEVDHIKARYEGGGDELENLRTLCLGCHRLRTKNQIRSWKNDRQARNIMLWPRNPGPYVQQGRKF